MESDDEIYDILTCLCQQNEQNIRNHFQIQLYTSLSERTKKPLLTTAKIESIIKILKDHMMPRKKNKKIPRSLSQKYHVKFYTIAEIPGKTILLAKSGKSKSKYSTVVPAEQYYDVIKDVHLSTGHGSMRQILMGLKHRLLFIPAAAVDIFVKSLEIPEPEVNTEYTIKKSHRQRRGTVVFIDLKSVPDGEYKWVLYYKELPTKLCVLRPAKTNNAFEAAQILLNIFLNIGFPESWKSELGIHYLKCVAKEMRTLWTHGCFVISQTEFRARDIDDSKDLIFKMIVNWVKKNKNGNWATQGIHFIQYDLNCKPSENNKTPLEMMFHRKPTLNLNEQSEHLEIAEEFDYYLDIACRESHSKVQKRKKPPVDSNADPESYNLPIEIEDDDSLGDQSSEDEDNDKDNSNGLPDIGDAVMNVPGMDDSRKDIINEDAYNQPSTSGSAHDSCPVCRLWCRGEETCAACGRKTHRACGDMRTHDVDRTQVMFECNKCIEYDTDVEVKNEYDSDIDED